MLAIITRRLGHIRLNKLVYRCNGGVISRRRMKMLDTSTGRGMLDMSVWRGMLNMLRTRDMRSFLVTFCRQNFKTLIK
uniref:Uncharacterized protein n=1 Tax=Cucumis melo TaxID=3656 RepID=A0A9I9D4X8_CUCME